MLAVAVGFAVSVLGGSGADAASGRLGGDFPAFYAAGTIIAEGDWESLYDPDRQLEAQQALFSESDNSFLYFAYPPHVASLYRPLATVDYRLAYTIHSLAMVGAVIAALALLRPVVPLLKRHTELAVIATLLFYPMLRGVTGGQNTALTLLLIAATMRALHDNNDVAAGLSLSLLLYKPQFAIPILGLLFVAGRWRAAAAGAAGGLILWGVGVMVMGTDWLGQWWTEVSAFAELDADVNGHNAVSLLGFAEGLFGAGSGRALGIAVPLMAATAAALVALWRWSELDLNARMALTIAGVVLLSPHAMFYDVGALALAGVVAVDRLGRRAVPAVVAVWALAWSQFVADELRFAPLFIVVVAGSAWLAAQLLREPRLGLG